MPTTRGAVSVGRTHQAMLVVFFFICAGMVAGTLAWRSASEGIPSDSIQPPPKEDRAALASEPPLDSGISASPGSGAVTTEIRILQPNYSVAPGDTLASIARRHGTTIEALAAINNLENRNALSVGQRLIIL